LSTRLMIEVVEVDAALLVVVDMNWAEDDPQEL
jgi:hypothetical protein